MRIGDKLLVTENGNIADRQNVSESINFWLGSQQLNDVQISEIQGLLGNDRFRFSSVEPLQIIYDHATSAEGLIPQLHKKFLETADLWKIEPSSLKPINIVILPELSSMNTNEYGMSLGQTTLDGEKILMATHEKTAVTFVHEATHAMLCQKYGPPTSLSVAEGAARYTQLKIFPGDQTIVKDHRMLLANDVWRIRNSRKQEIGVSITQMLENSGSQGPYSTKVYGFGYLLTEYLIERYGMKKYLEFYAFICAQNKYDTITGKHLIHNNQVVRGVKEREIINAALRSAGLDKGINQFDDYVFNHPDLK